MKLLLVDAAHLAPYAAGLRALERDITYPLADGQDRFWIDHGAHYHPFFSALGEAHFLIALDGDAVVGTAAGILRTARFGERAVPTGYACDLKLAPSHRGRGVARDLLLHGLRHVLTTPRFRRWRYAYGAAMRSARGDVMRSARGLHPARLFRPDACLRLFFVPAPALRALDPSGCPPLAAARTPGLELSPTQPGLGLVSTAGTKDLRLVSARPQGREDAQSQGREDAQSQGREDARTWPLTHLTHGPRDWPATLGDYLARAGRALPDEAIACFGLDERLAPQLEWLAARGLVSDTVCTIYGWRLPGGPRDPAWIHLATSEI